MRRRGEGMKILQIVRKEYYDIVKKKSFIISTILTPILWSAFLFIPMLIALVGRGEKTICIADYTGFVGEKIVQKTGEEPGKSFLFKKIEPGNRSEEDIKEEYRRKILDKEVDGLLLIPKGVESDRKIFFYASNISDFETNRHLATLVENIVSSKVLLEKGIDPDLVNRAIRQIQFETHKVKKQGTAKASSGMDYMMSILMLSLLFSVLMAYGQLIMRGVIEEKNNRIIEVLISSTRPRTLFLGKLYGIGMAGLTQVVLWIILGVLLMGSNLFSIDDGLSQFLTLELGLYFALYFVLGYFMYAIMFAIVGAAVNTDQEAQQFSSPLIFLLLVPFILGLTVTQNPNTLIVKLTSLFPPFTPTLMFVRISVTAPPMGEILLSILLCVLFIVFLAWLGAKIFQIGILMYGKRPSIKEMMKWIRY